MVLRLERFYKTVDVNENAGISEVTYGSERIWSPLLDDIANLGDCRDSLDAFVDATSPSNKRKKTLSKPIGNLHDRRCDTRSKRATTTLASTFPRLRIGLNHLDAYASSN
jgi:hypothetical protein